MRCGPAFFSWPLLQFLRQELIHQLRVRLALRQLHYLSDKESDYRRFSSAIFLHLLGICRNQIVDDFLQCWCIAELLWLAFFFVDNGEVLAALKAEVVQVLEHLARDRSRLDQI